MSSLSLDTLRLLITLLSLQAMRYPLNAHKTDLAQSEEARGRERELASNITDGDIVSLTC